MRKKRLFSLFLVFILAVALAAGCGGKDEDAGDQEDPKKTEASAVDDKAADKQEDAAEEQPEDPVISEEVNEYGFTEAQVQSLYECIRESVLTEYLQPNNISPESFIWPEDFDAVWRYIDSKLQNYSFNGDKDMIPDEFGADYDSTFAEPVFTGIINWTELPETGLDPTRYAYYIPDIRAMLDPIGQTIPANVSFAQ